MPSLQEALKLKAGGYYWKKFDPNGYNGSTITATNLTYNFYNVLPSFYKGREEANGFKAVIPELKTAVKDVFAMLSTFTKLTFTETTNPNTAQIGIGMADLPVREDSSDPAGYAYYPITPIGSTYHNPLEGDAWFDTAYITSSNLAKGQFGYHIVMHEIGHALGLRHTHDVGVENNSDNIAYSVMSYNSGVLFFGPYWGGQYEKSFMLYDIYALQSIYGANMSYKTGNDIYNFNALSYTTTWDAGGTDSIIHTGNDGVAINLNAGEWSLASQTVGFGTSSYDGGEIWVGRSDSYLEANSRAFTIAYNVTIENAEGGSAKDYLIGNTVGNTLKGNGGNDFIAGNAGNDILYGGSGNDTLYGGSGNDTLYGGEGNDYLYGGSGSDTLYGDAGSDTLYIVSGDLYYGGTGGDRFVVQNNATGIVFIKDFKVAEGDKLDLSNILDTYDPLTQNINSLIFNLPNYVMPGLTSGAALHITDSNSTALIALNGVAPIDLNSWILNGTIII